MTPELNLAAAAAVIGVACIVGILYWLWKKWKLRRPPPPKKDPEK